MDNLVKRDVHRWTEDETCKIFACVALIGPKWEPISQIFATNL